MMDKFKAADEPQILALGREETTAGSTKRAPEEMHAMNAETGDAGCARCEKFGKDECWTHSSFHCSVCDKRGKICLCVRKKQQLAQGKPWVRKNQRPGAKAQIAPLEAMVATLREELDGLKQRGEEKEKELAASPEETPMAQKKEVGFLDDDEIGGGGLEHFMFQITADGEEHTSATEEESDDSHNTEQPPLEHHFGPEFDDPAMPKAKETPASSSIDRIRERVAKMESEEKAEDQRRAAELTRSPAAEKEAELAKREAKEMTEIIQREERVLAKRKAEKAQKLAEMTEPF